MKRPIGWKMLSKQTAPNALHNSSARFDRPKCDEDTRVEVNSELMNWIQDRDAPQRLLCITGAAGAGKSALQQTLAESCTKSDILAAGFFFSAVDSTRNNSSTIATTIAYQIGLCNQALRQYIGAAIEHDQHIFSRELKTQMDVLIVRPVQRLRSLGFNPNHLPQYVIIIDGLDECQGERHQAGVLSIVKQCLLDNDLPFRIVIASRPEWAIRSALEPGGYLHGIAYHLRLSDNYDASADIRRYLWRRLRDIGSRSSDPRARSPLWPSQDVIEMLVKAASGQFVYAATVVKYVSERHSSPVDKLQVLTTWTSTQHHQARPFETLDILYSGILRTARAEYEAVDTNSGRDFLLLLAAHHFNAVNGIGDHTTSTAQYSAATFDSILNLEEGAFVNLISDLRSLVTLESQKFLYHGGAAHTVLRFYHLSFSEFMNTPSRSRDVFVSPEEICAFVAKCCLRNISRHSLESREFSVI
ncbi:hypothetical protein EST38_g2203 [Candolleomyces aberdarensis]|uniref:Nephrocystin 3-like N-terminal domain-containing protein n=1 Tax=Candolleomyces aberdarensis TaxID=2316362 RepID=A0A4Q2DTU0_9AGAR|nr:hypothetical protein EST38_g2203 [Candolleomyces aberdarensis]